MYPVGGGISQCKSDQVEHTRYAPLGMVCSVDHLASSAGVAMLRAGGSAADAAIAANAVVAVTCQHMCGMGGDLFAVVHAPGERTPVALNASGRSGSGANPEAMRRAGHSVMPMRGDIRSVPVPGCVDGWVTLHERFGRLPLADVLESARRYAADGFSASPLLAWSTAVIADVPHSDDYPPNAKPGTVIRRPGVARALEAIGSEGRDAFYRGDFGKGLVALGNGEFADEDLATPNADWVQPLRSNAWGHDLWTIPPNSQGYLTLASAWIADQLDLPSDPTDPAWAHLLIEASRQAAFDRDEVLHEGADGAALVSRERLAPRAAAIDPQRAASLGEPAPRPGGTTYLCAVDGDRMGVSLIQSNASGFGAHIVEPNTRIFLQDRGIGFSLEPGHPAEYGPRKRPPHTLSPALVTTPEGGLHSVVGTMGGDSQPQILLQILARLLAGGAEPGEAVASPRWVLGAQQGGGGFDTWKGGGAVQVELEKGTPESWSAALTELGHVVAGARNVGHAHLILNRGDHIAGASDWRSFAGAAAGL